MGQLLLVGSPIGTGFERCGSAAAHCGKASPYRHPAHFKVCGEAEPRRRIWVVDGKPKAFRNVRRQSHAELWSWWSGTSPSKHLSPQGVWHTMAACCCLQRNPSERLTKDARSDSALLCAFVFRAGRRPGPSPGWTRSATDADACRHFRRPANRPTSAGATFANP